MEIVHLVNRTSQPFTWQYNAIVYVIGPYEKKPFERFCAEHGKSKSRFDMDMLTGAWKFRLAVVEYNDSVEPLDKAEEPKPDAELFNRATDPDPERAKAFKEGKIVVKKFANPVVTAPVTEM